MSDEQNNKQINIQDLYDLMNETIALLNQKIQEDAERHYENYISRESDIVSRNERYARMFCADELFLIGQLQNVADKCLAQFDYDPKGNQVYRRTF